MAREYIITRPQHTNGSSPEHMPEIGGVVSHEQTPETIRRLTPSAQRDHLGGQEAFAVYDALREQLNVSLYGQEEAKDVVIAGTVSGEPTALMGPPATGKSTIVRSMIKATGWA
jgi:hypothetical protein